MSDNENLKDEPLPKSREDEVQDEESINNEQPQSNVPEQTEETDGISALTDPGRHETGTGLEEEASTKAADMGEKNKPYRNSYNKAEFFEWLEMVIFACCFVLVVFTFLVRPARVIGASMENTLFEGDTLFISDLFYTPEYGDIIVFQDVESSKTDPIVKRVIATEGQWVKIEQFDWPKMTVWVSDTSDFTGVEPLDESIYVKLVLGNYVNCPDKPFQVPEGHIFVMGDNRNHSLDSRSSTFSFIDEDKILGKVLIRIYPFNRFCLFN